MTAPDISYSNRVDRPSPQAHLLILVLLCHFLSAFTALGMPLFLPRMLVSIDPLLGDYWVGFLFVAPSVCTALVAAYWGRFADKYGKRASLLRAQLGLSLGFIVSGFASSIEIFTLGLIIQGLCGGTLAASNAYLSSMQMGKELAQSLNYTQLSARLALLFGPVVLGLFTRIAEPLMVYRYLALLPLLAFVIAWFFPENRESKNKFALTKDKSVSAIKNRAKAQWNAELTTIITLQFLFSFSMVVTFPYFLQFSYQLGLANDSVIGLIYSLPHLVYLVLIYFVGKFYWSPRSQATMGLIALGLACAGHSMVESVIPLCFLRLLFGIGMVLSYNGIHRLLSDQLLDGSAGFIFGRFDACGKWAGVGAGLLAGLLVTFTNPVAPFIVATVSSLIAVILLIKRA